MKIIEILPLLLLVLLLTNCQTSVQSANSEKLDTSPEIKTPIILKTLEDTFVTGGKEETDSSEITPKEKIRLTIKISIDSIFYQRLKFIGQKEEMLALMGQPDTIIEPKYECGPYSEDWQETPFYQYFYGSMNFIVYKDIAEIQSIKFDEFQTITINNIELNGQMNLKEVAEKLSISIFKNADTTLIETYPIESRDEQYYLKFKKGKLSDFDRYEPC